MQKAAKLYKTDPLRVISSVPSKEYREIENATILNASTFHTFQGMNEKQNDAILSLVSSTNTNHFENVYSFPINSNFYTYKSTNEKQNDAILKLIDNVTEMNSRVMELLERK